MKVNKKDLVLLGIAFIFQFLTSLISGLIPSKVLPGNSLPANGFVDLDLVNVANNEVLIRTSIIGQVITAIGIIFLGVMLYIVLKQVSKKIAIFAFGLYILEAALLAASMLWAFHLLAISSAFVATADNAYLQVMGNVAFQTMGFGMTLALLPFCLGGILFYYLLYISKLVPRWLVIWGLLGASIVLIATLFTIFGVAVPVAVYVPYVPFELAVGIWILYKATSNKNRA